MSILRAIRRDFLGISQEELARRAGLNRDTISRAEHPEMGVINQSTAALIAKALNDLQAEYDMSQVGIDQLELALRGSGKSS